MSYTPSKHKQLYHQTRRLLAHYWLKLLHPQVIGITGSYGKTSATQVVSSVLASKHPLVTTDVNLDTNFNLPITLLKLRPSHKFAVLEYGIDHLGEMDANVALAMPDIAVLTGITAVHAEPGLLGSLENIITEKTKLLTANPQALKIINLDDPHVASLKQTLNGPITTFGTHPSADYYANRIKVTTKGTHMTIHTPTDKFDVQLGLIGRHFAHAALIAVIIAQHYGLKTSQIKRAFRLLKPLPGRMSIEPGPLQLTILNDSKRANPVSTMAGLDTFSQIETSGRRIAILGEMGELGAYAISSHQQVGVHLASLKNIDYFIAIGPLMQYAAQTAMKNGMDKTHVFMAKDVQQAADQLKGIAQPQDFIYLKGSLLKHMERILLLLEPQNQVGCNVISCPFYHQCTSCQYLKTGYKGKKNNST